MPPVAAKPTREVFWELSEALEVLWYGIAIASVLVFAYGVARPIAKYRQGRRDFLPLRGEILSRLRTATRALGSQATIKRRATAKLSSRRRVKNTRRAASAMPPLAPRRSEFCDSDALTSA